MFDQQFGRSPASVDYTTQKTQMRDDLVGKMMMRRKRPMPGMMPQAGAGQMGNMPQERMPMMMPRIPNVPNGPGIVGGIEGGLDQGGQMLGPQETWSDQPINKINQLMQTDFVGGSPQSNQVDPTTLLQVLKIIARNRRQGYRGQGQARTR